MLRLMILHHHAPKISSEISGLHALKVKIAHEMGIEVGIQRLFKDDDFLTDKAPLTLYQAVDWIQRKTSFLREASYLHGFPDGHPLNKKVVSISPKVSGT